MLMGSTEAVSQLWIYIQRLRKSNRPLCISMVLTNPPNHHFSAQAQSVSVLLLTFTRSVDCAVSQRLHANAQTASHQNTFADSRISFCSLLLKVDSAELWPASCQQRETAVIGSCAVLPANRSDRTGRPTLRRRGDESWSIKTEARWNLRAQFEPLQREVEIMQKAESSRSDH